VFLWLPLYNSRYYVHISCSPIILSHDDGHTHVNNTIKYIDPNRKSLSPLMYDLNVLWVHIISILFYDLHICYCYTVYIYRPMVSWLTFVILENTFLPIDTFTYYTSNSVFSRLITHNYFVQCIFNYWLYDLKSKQYAL